MSGIIVGDNEIARLYTVGHSTQPLDALVALLHRNGVAGVADVRTVPKSRRLPQYNREALADSLAAAGIAYAHVPELGGFRRPARDSPNGGWRNDSFRGYADHMRSVDFEQGLERLRTLARERPTAAMCAEALWHRCHRRLVADALVARGWEVLHIRSDGRTEPHALTPFAVVERTAVSYPPEQGSLGV